MNVFENIFLVLFCAILGALIPALFTKLGFFHALGKTKTGTRVAEFFGSKEPTVFVKNAFQIIVFAYLAHLFFTGITTKALLYELHEPLMKVVETCNGTLTIGKATATCVPSLFP